MNRDSTGDLDPPSHPPLDWAWAKLYIDFKQGIPCIEDGGWHFHEAFEVLLPLCLWAGPVHFTTALAHRQRQAQQQIRENMIHKNRGAQL